MLMHPETATITSFSWKSFFYFFTNRCHNFVQRPCPVNDQVGVRSCASSLYQLVPIAGRLDIVEASVPIAILAWHPIKLLCSTSQLYCSILLITPTSLTLTIQI